MFELLRVGLGKLDGTRWGLTWIGSSVFELVRCELSLFGTFVPEQVDVLQILVVHEVGNWRIDCHPRRWAPRGLLISLVEIEADRGRC